MPAILPTNPIDSDPMLSRFFLPYQIHWIQVEDSFHAQKRQVFALAEKSVRIGWTYADAFKNVRKRLRFTKRDYLFATKDYPSALEYMRLCYDFAGLLEAVASIDGIARIRFASPHPRHVSPRLLATIRDIPQVCKHLHLPVQSGSTTVLGRMRRRYTRESYLDLLDLARNTVPGLAISTDMIVGFPGETAADFEQTLSLTRAARYHSMYSFKYSERPNTLASKRLEDDVPEEEKSRRIVELQGVQRDIQSGLHQGMVGQHVDVLIDSVSRRRDSEVSGRTSGNTVVNVPGSRDWIGRTIAVTIRRAGPNSVWGEASAGSA